MAYKSKFFSSGRYTLESAAEKNDEKEDKKTYKSNFFNSGKHTVQERVEVETPRTAASLQASMPKKSETVVPPSVPTATTTPTVRREPTVPIKPTNGPLTEDEIRQELPAAKMASLSSQLEKAREDEQKAKNALSAYEGMYMGSLDMPNIKSEYERLQANAKAAIDARTAIETQLETEQYVNKYNDKIADKNYEDNFGGQFDANYRAGRLSQDSASAWSEYVKNPTAENKAKAQAIDNLLIRFQTDNAAALDDEGVVAGWITKDLAGHLPQEVDQTVAKVIGGLAGALVAGGTGYKVGSTIGSGVQSYDTMRGAAYKALVEAGVDEEVALAAAKDEAFLSSIIEMGDTALDWIFFGVSKAGAATGASKLASKAASAVAGKLPANVTAAMAKAAAALGKVKNLPAPMKVAAGYLGNIPQEGAEEGSQEIISIANIERAQRGETGFTSLLGESWSTGKEVVSDLLSGKSTDRTEQVKDAAKQGMKIAVMTGAGQTGVRVAAQAGINAARTKAADVKSGEALTQANQHLDLLETVLGYTDKETLTEHEGFNPASKSYQMAQSFLTAIQNSDNSVDAVSNAQWGRLTRIMAEEMDQYGPSAKLVNEGAQVPVRETSAQNTEQQTATEEETPLINPAYLSQSAQNRPVTRQATQAEVQQAQQEVVQALHPDEEVMSTTAQAFLDAGVEPAEANTRSKILDRIVAGDDTLSNSEIKKLNFQDPLTRATYTSVVGHALPATNANKDLIAAVRADIKAAQEQKVQAEEKARQDAAWVATIEANARAKASAAEAAKLNAEKVLNDSTEAVKAQMVEQAQENAKAAQETSAQTPAETVSQTAPTVKLSNGEELTEEQFVQRYQSAKKVDTAEAQRMFKVAQDTNGFGQDFPATDLTAQENSAVESAFPGLTEEEAQQMFGVAARASATAERPAQTSDGAERHSASRRQRTAQGHDTRREVQQAAQTTTEQASVQSVEAGEADSAKTTVDTTSEIKPTEGRQIAEESSLSRVQKTALKVLRDTLVGTNRKGKQKSIIKGVEYVRNGTDTDEAFIMDDVLYINADLMTTGQAVLSVISHELTHGAETTDAGIVDDVLNFAVTKLGLDLETELAETTETYKKLFTDLGKSEAYIKKFTAEKWMRGEVAAEIMRRNVFPNVAAMNILARDNRTTFQRMRDGVESFIARMVFGTPETSEMQNECERLLERMNSALKNTENESKMNAETSERFAAGRDVKLEFQREFTGRVTCDEFIDLSRQELSAISHALKTGYGHLDDDGNGGGVNALGHYYMFDVLRNGGIHVTDVIPSDDLNIHTDTVEERYEYDGERNHLDSGRSSERSGGKQRNSREHLSAGKEARQSGADDRVAGTEPEGNSARDLREVQRTAQDEELTNEGTPATGEDAFSNARFSARRARTDTEEFRNWFHDDSGELTNPDGTPKVFLRGDTFSGATQFFSGAENHSGGIFFSTDMDTAGFYAHQYDDNFSMKAPEFMPKVYESWVDAFESTQDGELGNNVAVERTPDGWELMVRRREENRIRWESLKTFPNTTDGLAQFNDQYGQLLRDAAVENPAYMQVYLSAQNTKVIDAEGRTWNDVDSAGLRTNDLARQAWEDGYDMVIVKNVRDGAPAGMEFDEFDNFKAVLKAIDVFIAKDSTQVKSVYNTGSFDAENPDVRYSAGNAYREYAPTFYSKMEQEISAFKQAKMGASSVVSYLKGHGVKDEEIKWSGIEQWLEGKKSVTKEELLEFAKLNAVELEEQVLDGHKELQHYLNNDTGEAYLSLDELWAAAYEAAEERGYSEKDVRLDYIDLDSLLFYVYKGGNVTDEDDILLDISATYSDKATMWDYYKTPGGDNYRELLYKMPGSEYTNFAMDKHWGDADEGSGVLAHARVQDFETEDGTMLFIDEIQSDWHNAGAKEGYVSKDVAALQQELRDLRAKDVWNGEKTETEVAREAELNKLLYPKHAELNAKRAALKAQLSEDEVLSSVVDKIAEAKFDGNRRYAENNIHAARAPSMYIDDLSALGVRLTAEESDALRKFINSVNEWNQQNQEYTMNGGREAELANRAPEAPYSKNYHEYVLKRLIREAAENGYDSIGWTTGKMQEERWSSEYAEGYRIEYDQDMPKFLNKYGKQWGAKVEKARITNGIDAETIRDQEDYLLRQIERAENDAESYERNGWDASDERNYAANLRKRLEDLRGPEIWKMKITDQMREDVLYKGQPRYSVSKKQPFAEQVHRALTEDLKENRWRALYIAETPNTLAEVGLGDLPLCMTAAHAREINHEKGKNYHWHDLPEGLIAQLPNLLRQPVAILDSDTQPGDVVIVTGALDKDKAPVLVSIHPNGSADVDGVHGPANFITSMYGKDRNFAGWVELNAKNGKVLYWNKERTQKLFRLAGLQLPAALTNLSSDEIIRPYTGYVKEKTPERRFSAGKKGNTKTGGSTGSVNPETGYEAGSVADSFMRILNTGDSEGALNVLEEAARMLAEAKAQRAEQQRQEQLSQVFRPKLTEDAIERNERIINDLIAKYGQMEQTSAAQQEVRFPKKIDANTKVRGFVQTAAATNAATEDVRNTLADDIVKGRVGATYQPVSDRATLDKISEQFSTKTGFERALREWRAKVDSGTMPSKEDIALGEALFVQACAEGQTFEAQKLASEIAIMGTQLGQAVQAMSLVKRMTPAGQLYYIQKTVDRLNAEKAQQKRNVRIVIDEKLAQQLLAAKNKDEMDAAIDAIIQSLADQMPVTIYDKWNTWRYLSMLGNPRTHFRNLAGNAIFVPARLIKDAAAMGMERMVIKDKSKRTKGIADKDLRAFAMEDADLMGDELRDGGKYETKDLIRDRRRIFKLAPLNWAAQTNSRLLEAEDWVFLKSAYANALGGYLAAQGFTAEQVSGTNSTPEGRAALDRARVYAVEEAKKATYRDASKLAQWMNHSARNTGPVGSIIWGGLMPFTKTPVNIIKRGIEYSPVGLMTTIAKGATKLRKGEMTAAQFIDGLAAGLTGTAIVGLGYALAHMGLLVGGLGDDDEDKFEQLQGNQEYSIKLGDHSFTIDWMAPTVLPLFVGEAIHKFSENEGVNGWEVLEAAAGLLDPIMSLSMLDGLNQTLSAVKYDTGEPIPAILQTIVGSYVSQGIPTVLGSVARTIDDSRRASFTPSGQTSVQRWLSRLWQTSFLGKTPIAAEKRMAYVDEWGRTDTENSVLMRALENFVSPGYINPLKETPLESEIARLAEATGDNGVYPNKAQKYFSVGGETYAMSQDEYEEHLLFRGQKSYQLASDITTSRTYDALDDKTRAKALELAYDYAATLAKLNTNEAYAADKWILKLAEFEKRGGDAAEYLMLRAQSKTADLSLTEQVLSDSGLSAKDAAELIVMERTMPTSFTDPYISGYEYKMDEAAQERYAQMYHDLYLSAYLELVQDDEFIEGTLADRKKMVSELGTEVGKQVKYDMADWYWEQGIDSTEKS